MICSIKIYIPIWLDLLYIMRHNLGLAKKIYIPIWLDLLYLLVINLLPSSFHLHSNMVRFIIGDRINASNKRYSIYIPIWLDLL